MSFIYVFLGGGIGAVFRYLLSLVVVKIDFPVMTFLANVLGCFFIGIITSFAIQKSLDKNALLFLKTGFCGGFTTFSTFSLEAILLFQAKNFLLGGLYIILSVVFCLLGVLLGSFLVSKNPTA